MSSWYLYALLALLYPIIVSRLRFRRLRRLEEKYGYTTWSSLASMTIDQAFVIQKTFTELEMPTIISNAVFFALFKTYGIPSISKVLVRTGQLSNPVTSSKRAADTGALLTEFILNDPKSERTLTAIARMNYLHDRLRKKGLITDKDMLYTLSLFALEPHRWTAKYEWRALTRMERCATGVFWKHIGDSMEIPLTSLPSSEKGWENGVHFLTELDAWSQEYEEQHMIPSESNKQLADSTMDIALYNVPLWAKTSMIRFVTVLLGDRLARAMMLEAPPWYWHLIAHSILNIRKFILRYLCLPRPKGLRTEFIDDHPNPATGRYYARTYAGHPWYVRPTRRWNPHAWYVWLVGGILPGDHGDKYLPQGYHMAEIGPATLKNKGVEEMEASRARLMAQGNRKCPFSHM